MKTIATRTDHFFLEGGTVGRQRTSGREGRREKRGRTVVLAHRQSSLFVARSIIGRWLCFLKVIVKARRISPGLNWLCLVNPLLDYQTTMWCWFDFRYAAAFPLLKPSSSSAAETINIHRRYFDIDRHRAKHARWQNITWLVYSIYKFPNYRMSRLQCECALSLSLCRV